MVQNNWQCLRRLLERSRERTGAIDYRLVLVGSLLPDILDKPLWFFSVNDFFPSGSDYGHTLLFNLVLLICGLILIRYNKPFLLVISLSSLTHLVLDNMWNNPTTLLGSFQVVETANWLPRILDTLFTDPGTYIPEAAGLLIILLLGYRLMASKKIIRFIRTGIID
jgi:hypothetical protein